MAKPEGRAGYGCAPGVRSRVWQGGKQAAEGVQRNRQEKAQKHKDERLERQEEMTAAGIAARTMFDGQE